MRIIARILGIKKDEYIKVFLLFSYNLFLIMMFRIGRMVNDTLVVARLGADKLTFAYLGTSIVLACTIFIYFRIADSFKRIKFLSITALIFCISLLVSKWILHFQYKWFYQFLYIWVEAFGTIMVIQFYTLVSDIFNTRDAKRLFGIIGTGGVIGSIISGIIVRYSSRYLGPDNLFFMVCGAVFLCFVIINIIPKTIDITHLQPKPRLNFQYNILKSKHIKYISLISGLAIIVSTILDFQFNKLLESVFMGRENALLSFRGSFCTVLGIISLFFQTFLDNRILLRFGLLTGLLILPSSILLGTIVVLLGMHTIPIILNQAFDFTFRYTIDNSSRHIALLPISTEIRGRIKTFVEGVVKYVSIGVSALILILFNKVLSIPYTNLSYILIIFVIAWIYYAFLVKKEYVSSVISGIKDNRIDLGEIELKVSDRQTIKILEKALIEDAPLRITYALDLLSEIPGYNIKPHLINLLNHKSPLVRISVLKKIDDLPLIQSMFTDPSPEITSGAINRYCELLKEKAVPRIKPFLENENLNIRSSAIFGLIKYANYPLDPLVNLLDINKSHAIEIIGKLKLKEFADRIIQYLSAKGLRTTSFYALKEIGEPICANLELWLIDPKKDEAIRTVIPSILAEIRTDKSIALLEKHILIPEEKIRDSIIKAIHTTGRQIDTTDCIFGETQDYYNTLYTLQEISSTKILATALKDKLIPYRDRIFRLLEIAYPIKLITNIKKIKSDSIEALDNLLKGKLKKIILPILEDNPNLENVKEYLTLKSILDDTKDIWLRQCIIYEKEAGMFPLVEEVLFLKGVPLFSQLSAEELAKIAKVTEEKTFERGTTIFNEGDPSDALYITMRGKVGISIGDKHIKTLKEGDFFGELGMLDKGPRTAKAVVLEDAVLSRLGTEEFYELLSDNPQISHGIFQILTKKLRESYETT